METRSTLTKVFKRVMRGARYQSDTVTHGKREHWVLPPDVDAVTGDCEDIALAIVSLLDGASLIFCLTEQKEGHIVVEYDGWIADNRQKKVVTKQFLERQGYTWLSTNKTGEWRKIC